MFSRFTSVFSAIQIYYPKPAWLNRVIFDLALFSITVIDNVLETQQ